MKICTFAGHSDISTDEKTLIKTRLKNEIVNLIKNYSVTTFYNGGKGVFDMLCADCVKELKTSYPHIKSYLILAYMPVKKNKFVTDLHKNFDGTLYPEIEKIPPKFAIIKRNEWMINKSDFLIAYVNHTWGGAYKTFRYAIKNSVIKIINITG